MRRIIGCLVACLVVVAGSASAQWITIKLPRTPRTADGKPDLKGPVPRTSEGKPDLSGIWRRGDPPKRTNDTDNFDLLDWMPAGATIRLKPAAAALYQQRRDVLLVWGQNGEALRPEQGYPLRLIVPGWQGNVNIKWLRRIQIGDQPWYSREETSKYTELMEDGKIRGFTWLIYAKSVITFPCPEMPVKGPGLYEIRGFAWSGKGKVTQVDVSTDGGVNWQRARLQEPVLSKALTRFTHEWRWDGKPALLMSRAVDETGFVQPTIAELRAARGVNGIYNNNSIQTWQVKPDGSVFDVQLA